METPHAVGIDVSKATLGSGPVSIGRTSAGGEHAGRLDRGGRLDHCEPTGLDCAGAYRTVARWIDGVVSRGWTTHISRQSGGGSSLCPLPRSSCQDRSDRCGGAGPVWGDHAANGLTRPLERVRVLQALLTRHEQLAGDIATERTRLSSAPVPVRESITTHITWLQSQITAIDAALARELAEDAELSEQANLLPDGTRDWTAHRLRAILQSPELGTGTRKELAALVGVAPFARDSGVFRGKRVT